MPSSPSSKKRLRQSIDRRARNRVVRSTLRTQIKKVRTAVAAGDVATSETEFRTAVVKLDKAAAKNILHANSAARLKSRLSKAVKGIKTKATA